MFPAEWLNRLRDEADRDVEMAEQNLHAFAGNELADLDSDGHVATPLLWEGQSD